MTRKILPRNFYARSPLAVAPDLLGRILFRRKNGVVTSGRIVEVEAYLGSKDPASHAFRGLTPRNQVMFGPAGCAYIYFTYGNHFCMNVVTGKEGRASAVLIRALEPLDGIPTMKRRRRRSKLADLTSGPGKLTQALHIDRALNGEILIGNKLWISAGRNSSRVRWERTPRIGIREATDRLYRFAVSDSSFVSRRRVGPA